MECAAVDWKCRLSSEFIAWRYAPDRRRSSVACACRAAAARRSPAFAGIAAAAPPQGSSRRTHSRRDRHRRPDRRIAGQGVAQIADSPMDRHPERAGAHARHACRVLHGQFPQFQQLDRLALTDRKGAYRAPKRFGIAVSPSRCANPATGPIASNSPTSTSLADNRAQRRARSTTRLRMIAINHGTNALAGS